MPLVVAGGRGDRRRPRRRGPRPGHRRQRCGATPATSTCAGSPGSTTTPWRSTPTAAAAGRSARSTRKTGPRGPTRSGYADRRSTLSSGRHHGAVGRRQPAGAVALRHGPDASATARSTRRIKPGTPASPLCRAGVGGGQFGRGVGAGGLPEPGRPAADAAAAADEEDTPELKYVPQTGVTDESRRPGGGRVGHHDRGLRADARSRGSTSSTKPARRSPARWCPRRPRRRARRCRGPAT